MRSSKIFLSFRFQLFGAIIVASLIPALIRQFFDNDIFSSQTQFNTFIGTAVAITFGYILHRRIAVIPGVKADFYIIPIYAISFYILVLFMFLARIDYTRVTLISGFFAVIFWFHGIAVLSRRVREYSLAVVPGGDVEALLELSGVRWVMLSDTTMPHRTWNGLVADLRADLSPQWVRFISETALAGTPVFHVKEIRESLTGMVEIEHLSENTLGSLNPNEAYRELKHTLDWLSALLALIVLLPAFAVISILIKIDSSGPVLFRQERRGYRGRAFKVFKFRTMIATQSNPADVGEGNKGAEHAREQARTKERDARVTRVGRVLRRTRLDELPQVLNILRGEMSWIGPRPEALVLSKWYESELPFYSYRHIVFPGITGWAQINQGHVSSVEDVSEKLHFDFYYIKNFSFWLDLIIIMRTAKIIFTGFGSR
ncbi:sugar transferase [Mesorhizobium retamae]|uniref:Sugar transferase n=1 Tax=Mesorhizobium retamae TaxID=2912854 RepID=A0ABS9QFR5_9HYPH|nr:sugar transferase [Mesorhizobium sp. IRAMC:0171]MCG7506269.1 sugar transferase [Mesorhizobium sp. IRAMC:0171]